MKTQYERTSRSGSRAQLAGKLMALSLSLVSLLLFPQKSWGQAQGTIVTVAGGAGVNGLPALQTPMQPSGLARGASGDLFIADQANRRILKLSPEGTSTVIASGFSFPTGNPLSLAADPAGNLYTVVGHQVHKVTPGGIVSTVAGKKEQGFSGDGGPAIDAQLSIPLGLAADQKGNLFIADMGNQRIRKISPDGVITTVAGNGMNGYGGDGGPATKATLSNPAYVMVDGEDNLYVSEARRIRKITPDGIINTVAGNGREITGFPADPAPSPAKETAIIPRQLAMDGAGNLYFNHGWQVLKTSPDGILTVHAGLGTLERGFDGDGGPATEAKLVPEGLATDGAGNLYIADWFNGRIRKVGPDGIITTIAGNGTRSIEMDGAPALQALLGFPVDIALDAGGSLYITQPEDERIRKVSPDGTIVTVAGNGESGSPVEGVPATQSPITGMESLEVDGAGRLYLSSGWMIDPEGIFRSLPTGPIEHSGDFFNDVALDGNGNVYFGLLGAIRKLAPDGNVARVAGGQVLGVL